MSEGTQSTERPVAILGAGNLGAAIARGLVRSGLRTPRHVHLTHLEPEILSDLAAAGHPTGSNNTSAASTADVLVVAVQPQDVDKVLESVRDVLDPSRHVVVSTATGVTLAALRRHVPEGIPVVRAMPNIGIQTMSSMTCLVCGPESEAALPLVRELFGAMGETVRISEENMNAATALCASGIAFFLRAIRAASEAGVEIGFHAEDAIRMAAQTAKGAAELLLVNGGHPEAEIDQVTTPNGCTIAGLNEMESYGFSAALVRGIVAAADRAASLYATDDED